MNVPFVDRSNVGRRALRFRLSTLLFVTVFVLVLGHLASYVAWRRHAIERHNRFAEIVAKAMSAEPPGMKKTAWGNSAAGGGQRVDESWIASATMRFSRNPGMNWMATYDVVLPISDADLQDPQLGKRIFDFYTAQINWPAKPTTSVVTESRSLRIWDGMLLDIDVDVDHLKQTATVMVIFSDEQTYSGW